MLLSCLVGGDKVDKGHIWVLGGQPRTKSSKTLTKYTGYMPQVLNLLYFTAAIRYNYYNIWIYLCQIINFIHKFTS